MTQNHSKNSQEPIPDAIRSVNKINTKKKCEISYKSTDRFTLYIFYLRLFSSLLFKHYKSFFFFYTYFLVFKHVFKMFVACLHQKIKRFYKYTPIVKAIRRWDFFFLHIVYVFRIPTSFLFEFLVRLRLRYRKLNQYNVPLC